MFILVGQVVSEPVQSVNSLDDLKNLQTTSSPISVLVKYRSQFNDNGGGIFIWDPASNVAADDALVIMPNNYSGAGRWLRKYEGFIYPCWFGSPDINGDDHAALQAAMDRPEPVRFDRYYATSSPVVIGRDGKTVDFNGYGLYGISTTAQDAVLWITGSNLTLYDVSINASFKPYNSAIHWFSPDGSQSENNRIYGLIIFYANIGILFGSDMSVSNPVYTDQSNNTIYGIMFIGVNNCIQMNQPGGALSVNGGNIDCGTYEWGSNFDAPGSRCYKVKNGDLRMTNCEFMKTQTQQGYAFEGPAFMDNSHIEAASNWFLNPGNTTLTACTGLMLNDCASYFNLDDGAAGTMTIFDCDFTRGDGVSNYSGQYMINASNTSNYDFIIDDSTFSEWKYGRLSNGYAHVSMTNVRFPNETGSFVECERQYSSGAVVRSGYGSPEGVVPALVGSMYLRADGGAGTCLYLKLSGTGSIGWVPLTKYAPAVQDLSIRDARNAADNALVSCSGYVSAVYSDCFYIEKGDRTSGIRVQKSGYVPTMGQNISVTGYTATSGSLERYINASDIKSTGSPNIAISPLGMTNNTLHCTGFANGVGLNCSGLLVRVWGRVIGQNGNRYTISDGSGAQVNVELRSGSIAVGKFVSVTGAVSCFNDGSAVQPLVIVNDNSQVASYD